MVGWHHRLDGHEFAQTPGHGEGREILTCFQLLGSQRMGHNLVTEQEQKAHWHFLFLLEVNEMLPIKSQHKVYLSL